MNFSDYFMTSLTCWREARGEPREGQIAICAVIANRSKRHNTTPYEECIKPWQFSSITAKGDPQLILYPKPSDTLWQQAKIYATGILDGTLNDPTNGSTVYYNPNGITSTATISIAGSTIKFPQTWNKSSLKFQVQIGAHYFFTEV